MEQLLIDTAVEAVALIVQIHLQQNRTDLAIKEVQAARRWAQDSLLVNLAESWVGLRVVSLSTTSSSTNPNRTARVERNTNKRSTFLKNWPKLPRHRQYRALLLKLLQKYISDDWRRLRQHCSRLCRRIHRMQRSSPIPLFSQ
jgi:hypothetical protein